ncbi:MAG: hypothetical protein KDC69_08935 [Flavobacteriaceae bacterium]|nr:hypothetical protein [Flavobacteriaceae bacterium]MCB0705758.1 hypothetical protein [Saprospiraceae bacterium]
MSTFFQQLKWQFLLLHKNNIINISFAVTLIYGILLFFLRDINGLDKLLVSLVLNDPSVIGYFFISLAIYTEIKDQVLPAIFVSPVNIHHFLISKTIAISFIGLICSIGLALSVKGMGFDIIAYSVGSLGVCLLSALLGVFMLTFASEFLKFAILSIPLFLAFVNISLLQYLGAIEMGVIKYLFPIQGSLDLIDYAISGTRINFWYSYVSILVMVPLFYWMAYRQFTNKIVHQ